MSREVFYVETSAPARRDPPVTEVGALGWLRANLFSNWWNSLLTLLSAAFVVWALVGFFRWAVGQADWSVITNNLHLFAIGTYPQTLSWRPLLAAGILMFLIGLTWRLWGRATRLVVMLVVLGVALLFVFPLLAAGLPFPDTYVLLGGPTTDPLPALAYVVQEGETITFTLLPIPDFTDPAPVGFMDRNSLTVAGLARQDERARQLAVERAIEAGETPPDLPEGSDALLAYQEGAFVILERDLVATVTVLTVPYERSEDAGSGAATFTQGQPQALETLSAGPGLESASAEVTFPQAGWILIVPRYEGTVGGFWLEMSTLAPLSPASSEVQARESQYGPPPSLEGSRVLALDRPSIPFRGEASVSEYVKLHLGPMSRGLQVFALVMVVITAGGYGLGALIKPQPWARRLALIGWLVSTLLFAVLLRGVGDQNSPLPPVSLDIWGGLLLTLVLAAVGIVVAFPIGVLLALGRRSELPVVRISCVLSIEFVRGVPLVTILFLSDLLVPLLDPSLANVDNVVRAMFGMTFFSAAYLAEVVRGGLQAIPRGQEEAAKALGMPGWQITTLIVLPQALRLVIPAIMGQFVSLFKDTSLVLIIGLIDLLGIARSVINQAEYIGLQRETLVFISVIYFVLSYLMSWVSRRLEETGSGVVRRA